MIISQITFILMFNFKSIPEATNDVIAAAGSAREGGEVAVLIQGPEGKGNRREILFRAMASDDDAISMYYNHKTNKSKCTFTSE